MKKFLAISILSCLLVPAIGYASELGPKVTATLESSLSAALGTAPADTIFDVLVAATDSRQLAQSIDLVSKGTTSLALRHQQIEATLRSLTAKNEASVLDALAVPARSRTQVLDKFWIANMMHIRCDREGLLSLAASGDVARIYPNVSVSLVEPVASSGPTQSPAAAGTNLEAVGVRTLWARGLNGHGRLVASIDTGVEGVHPALAGNWRGIHGDTAAAWFDPLNAAAPMDNNGHGTHVMGTMVGHDGADTIGIAPGAEWITAAVIDRGSALGATIADILRAFQWIADPDGNPETSSDVPDVVCNSWGISQSIISACDSVFFQAIANVEAMGIVCVFAAGNEGPNSMTLRNPADHAGSPTNAFAIGAVDATLSDYPVPSFSSRGPSACDGISIKPDIVAPGVAIRSSYKGQTYRFMNGTSMAAPHVAAAVALLRQYNPDLTPAQIKLALMSTATDVSNAGPDNESGHGLINIAAALAALPGPSLPTITVAGADVDPTGDGLLSPGETASLTVSLQAQLSDVQGLLGKLRPLTSGFSCPVDTARFAALPAGKNTDISSSPFTIAAAPSERIGDSVYFELTVSGGSLPWNWVDTVAMICSLPIHGQVGELTGAQMALGVSNLGQIGLGNGSFIDAGYGWRLSNGGVNVLYEGALMIAASGGRLSDASRRASSSPFDFEPLDSITYSAGASGSANASASFDDRHAIYPVGVEVSQQISLLSGTDDGRVAILEWTIHNRTALNIDSLTCGLLLDVDLPAAGGGSEHAAFDFKSGGYYHQALNASSVAGIIPLGTPFGSTRFYLNNGGKLMLSAADKLTALKPGTMSPNGLQGDLLEIVGGLPVTLTPSGEVTFAVALVLADSPQQFADLAGDARKRWLEITSVDGGEGGGSMLPSALLNQNFPNPFNPSTVISYSLKHDGLVRLDIFNLLGQHVRTLVDGWNYAGANSVTWDGADSRGRTVASGVYMYRLQTINESITKKMTLIR